jgi:hypothetical protein
MDLVRKVLYHGKALFEQISDGVYRYLSGPIR